MDSADGHEADHPAGRTEGEGRTEGRIQDRIEGRTEGRIEDHARGRVVSDAPLTRPVPVALRFDPGFSPPTVRFVFPGGVEWSFPRSLLETGLRAPARRGDVGVWPCGRVQTVVEFHGRDGVDVVQFDTTALTRFLRHTYAAKPAAGSGAEPVAGAAATHPVPSRNARTPSARQ
ncbi:SsgA family sporulation/cell division regulator [Streptomyces sp. NPDC003327]